jgi:hypothetical protein
MPDIHKRLEALPRLEKPALRAQWLEAFGRPAPARLRRDLLVRILAYRIQEQAIGGLSPATLKRLRQLARAFESDPQAALPDVPVIKPGTRLIRKWHDQVHHVTVVEKGYEYHGKRYGSLSQIARLITGTRWSGPLFFGLKTSRTKGGKHGR